MGKLLLCFLALCSFVYKAGAQDTVRICTYSLLNYSIDNEDGRTPHFKAVIGQIQLDILVVQDVVSQEAAFKFFTEALDPEAWSLSVFDDTPDADNMLYFNFSKFTYIGQVQHPTALRSITEYHLLHKATGDTVTIFSAYLNAGDTSEDADARAEETQVIHARLLEQTGAQNGNIIVCGNFNFYSTAEMGYMRLVMMNSSYLVDPLQGWTRDSEEYAGRYTQSTRTTADAACGAGVGGGLDDRFDMILPTFSMYSKYIQGSYTAYGNDGQPRLNQSINDPVNTAVSAELAASLRCASDHLPVYADFIFDTPTGVEEKEVTESEAGIYPMPVVGQGHLEIHSQTAGVYKVVISDILGRSVLSWDLRHEPGMQTLALPALLPGMYLCRVVGPNRQTVLPFTVVR